MTAMLTNHRPHPPHGRWTTDGSSAEAPDRRHLGPPVNRRPPLDRRSPGLVVLPPLRPRPPAVVHRVRRQVALGAATVLAVAGPVSLRAALAWAGGDATAGVVPPTPTVVVAEPGDSYWTLAARLHRGGDLRSSVDAVVRANGGRELRPGDRVVVGP